MINRWISAVAVPGLLLLAIAAQAAKVDVRTDYDRKFDFRRVQTWAWDAAEAGDVKMARTAEDDPAPVRYTHLRAHETRGYLVCRLLP